MISISNKQIGDLIMTYFTAEELCMIEMLTLINKKQKRRL